MGSGVLSMPDHSIGVKLPQIASSLASISLIPFVNSSRPRESSRGVTQP
jgi:hypothetical protein